MALRFPSGWLEELRSRVDIVSVVSEHVTLKQNGRRYWGLCPFHTEKTPSFSVNADQQLYYCFGCKAGGDVIHFVMETERMEFNEAVRHLAERVRLSLPEQMDRVDDQAQRSVRQTIQEMNRKAALFYHETLWKPEGKAALEYLYRRGLDDPTIRRFGLGATPPGWDGLMRHLQSEGYSLDQMVQAGLITRRENGSFDMFRQRVLFPILNAQGAVLAFGGRAMGDAQPKYLNSPDTPVFNKRQGVYAVNLLRKIRNLKRIVLVEGYMDVVSLVSKGISGVVATLGTALTQEQARLMTRYAREIHLAYDGDEAGQKAIERALDLLEPLDIAARVLVFPEGLDPDDFIRRDGVEAFQALKPISAAAFRMQRIAKGMDLTSEEGRAQYAIACAAVIRKVREPVEAEDLLKRLMVDTGYSREVLVRQVGVSDVSTSKQMHTVQPMRDMLQGTRGFLPEDVKAARQLLSLLATGRVPAKMIQVEDFEDGLHKEIAESLLAGVRPASIVEQYESNERRDEVLEIFGETPYYEEELLLRMVNDYMERMRLCRMEARIAEIRSTLATAEPSARAEGMKELLTLTNQCNRLKSGRKE